MYCYIFKTCRLLRLYLNIMVRLDFDSLMDIYLFFVIGTTKKYKIDHKKNDLCEDSTSSPLYTGKGVYKSLLEVSSKRLKRTDLLTKYEENILKTKLETALIKKETAMAELNIAKQKCATEQYIYESLKQNTDKC